MPDYLVSYMPESGLYRLTDTATWRQRMIDPARLAEYQDQLRAIFHAARADPARTQAINIIRSEVTDA